VSLAPENFDGWIDTERKISRPASGSTRLIRHHSKKHAFPDGDYLGNGPASVFQNRLAGGWLDVWDRKYNNITVGDPDDLAPGQHFDYPVFKGYYAGVRWLQLDTSEGLITALIHQNDLYVQVFKPKMPPLDLQRKAVVAYSKASIAFLHAIDAIGNKFSSDGV